MNVWFFWAAAAILVGAVAATLMRAMARARLDERASADFDLAVYRDQLTEIERDIARGAIAADEGARLRTEIQRRLLDTDRSARTAPQVSVSRSGLGGAAVVAVLTAGALGLYWQIGAPGYPDLPLQARLDMSEQFRLSRPSQAEAMAEAVLPPPRTDIDPDFAQLMDRLRQTVEERPEDARGLELLARNEAAIGNLAAAAEAQARLVALRAQDASAEDHAAHAELMVMAAGGYVSPEAEAALVRALEIDPRNGTARYYSGLMQAQIGRYDRAFVLWRHLLDEGPGDAPWIAPIRAQIEDLASRAGVTYTLPPAARGPNAADVAAAAEMTPEERQAMIEGMVDQLAERLAAEGGPAEEWARLITALAQIGRMDQARAIYAEAQTRFEGRSVDLSGLREAAVMAGVAE